MEKIEYYISVLVQECVVIISVSIISVSVPYQCKYLTHCHRKEGMFLDRASAWKSNVDDLDHHLLSQSQTQAQAQGRGFSL